MNTSLCRCVVTSVADHVWNLTLFYYYYSRLVIDELRMKLVSDELEKH